MLEFQAPVTQSAPVVPIIFPRCPKANDAFGADCGLFGAKGPFYTVIVLINEY